jgi:hypothetical protein
VHSGRDDAAHGGSGILQKLSALPVHRPVRSPQYEEELFFSQEIHATAKIITGDLRLPERLFLPLKKIFGRQNDGTKHHLSISS